MERVYRGPISLMAYRKRLHSSALSVRCFSPPPPACLYACCSCFEWRRSRYLRAGRTCWRKPGWSLRHRKSERFAHAASLPAPEPSPSCSIGVSATYAVEFGFEHLHILRAGGGDFLRIKITPCKAHTIDVLCTDIGRAAAQCMRLLTKALRIARCHRRSQTGQHSSSIRDGLRNDVPHEVATAESTDPKRASIEWLGFKFRQFPLRRRTALGIRCTRLDP